jgi:hypothetical protein
MRAWHVALIALPLLVAGAFPAAWLWRRRRARLAAAGERARVLEVACDSLRDIMVPDAAGGPVHIDYLLLTARGMLVIDYRDVAGVIFGGEHMDEWAVMSRSRRFTFPNPLGPLYDRVTAVRLAAGDAPVDGRVVFTERGRFPKGQPPQVTMLDELQREFPPAAGDLQGGARWQEQWQRVKDVATPSPLALR